MLLPFVKKFIYSYVSKESQVIEVKAKSNIMHATYAMVHSSGMASDDLDKARVVFMKLYSECFSKESMKVSFESCIIPTNSKGSFSYRLFLTLYR